MNERKPKIQLFGQGKGKTRWALIEGRYKGRGLSVSRARADGSTISIKMPESKSWMVVYTEDLLLAIAYATASADELSVIREEQNAFSQVE